MLVHRAYAGVWTGTMEWVGTAEVRPWINLLMITVLFLVIALYTFKVERSALLEVWGRFTTPPTLPFRAFLYWCAAFPCVLVISNAAHALLSLWITFPVVDQVAVQQVKLSLSNPFLYMLTSFSIVTMVPFVEEVLFRGFLQQYLKRYFPVSISIVAAAAIFALFHFSTDQGWMNVELIAALFAFSLFLGYIRESYQSLNGSIMLHSIFNGMSLLFLSVQEGLG